MSAALLGLGTIDEAQRLVRTGEDGSCASLLEATLSVRSQVALIDWVPLEDAQVAFGTYVTVRYSRLPRFYVYIVDTHARAQKCGYTFAVTKRPVSLLFCIPYKSVFEFGRVKCSRVPKKKVRKICCPIHPEISLHRAQVETSLIRW